MDWRRGPAYTFTDADSEHHGKVLCIKKRGEDEHVFINAQGEIFTCHMFGPAGNKVIGLVSRRSDMQELIQLAREMRRRGTKNPCAEQLLIETEDWE